MYLYEANFGIKHLLKFLPTPSSCARNKTQLVETVSQKSRKYLNQNNHCVKSSRENIYLQYNNIENVKNKRCTKNSIYAPQRQGNNFSGNKKKKGITHRNKKNVSQLV